ncbi:MAG: hypothetical protein GY906_32140, partial [bacterium]|nr:hypothetical protein [bacterium]
RTVVGYRGVLEKSTGVLTGTLVVRGEGDPDLQLENLFLMTRKLNQLGIRRVSEGLELQGVVTLGWEHGSEGRISDPKRRRQEMARRVRNAFDPRRWDRSVRNTWEGFCARRGLNVSSPPSVRIDGGATWAEASDFLEVVHHLSNPLPVVLKRFNVYSNNDIVRIADYLGGVLPLEAWLTPLLDAEPGDLRLETASGEGRNRITPRGIVRLLREFRSLAAAFDLGPADLLAVPGCDPGSVARMFPKLASGELARVAVVKTGTLRQTDGGVAVLAGYFPTADGSQVFFCVAAPRAGSELRSWRRLQQQWLMALMKATGPGNAMPCTTALPFSDDDAILACPETGD